MSCSIYILLVEDTIVAQKIAKAQMERHGCDVDIAATGEIAIEMAQANKYDLILMDIGLGDGIDGFETTREIKASKSLNEKTPVIAVTSHEGKSFLDKAKEVGMARYFNKPFTSQDAKDIVDFIQPFITDKSNRFSV